MSSQTGPSEVQVLVRGMAVKVPIYVDPNSSIGPLVDFKCCVYGKLYVLCPQPNCARPCRFEMRKYGTDSYACQQCNVVQIITNNECYFCSKKRKADAHWSNVRIRTEHGDISTVLCPKHYHSSFDKSLPWEPAKLRKCIGQNQQRRLGR